MRGGRFQLVTVENLSNILRRMAKESRKFDLTITDLSNLGQRAFKVLFHFRADRVELQADLLDFAVSGSPSQFAAEQCGGGDSAEKAASIHYSSPRFIIVTA